VAYCRRELAWYERMKQRSRLAYQTLQVVSILLGAATPVLILVTDQKLLQATVAAIAAVITGLLAAFRWRENYARFAYTAELLKAELFQFETQTSERYRPAVGEQAALENFVQAVTTLGRNEVADWRQQFQGPVEGAAQAH
jgi:hypothetical protein